MPNRALVTKNGMKRGTDSQVGEKGQSHSGANKQVRHGQRGKEA